MQSNTDGATPRVVASGRGNCLLCVCKNRHRDAARSTPCDKPSLENMLASPISIGFDFRGGTPAQERSFCEMSIAFVVAAHGLSSDFQQTPPSRGLIVALCRGKLSPCRAVSQLFVRALPCHNARCQRAWSIENLSSTRTRPRPSYLSFTSPPRLFTRRNNRPIPPAHSCRHCKPTSSPRAAISPSFDRRASSRRKS